MLTALRRFGAATGALAAVEFALIAPFMIALFFGLIETCNALSAHQKMTTVASTAADLTSQATELTKADMADIFSASSAIMTPFSNADVSIVITSLTGTKQANKGTVLWSAATSNGVAHTVGSSMDVGDPTKLASGDPGLLSADCDSATKCSLIVAEVTYNYTSPYGKFIVGMLHMQDVFYTKPRRVISVVCNNCAS